MPILLDPLQTAASLPYPSLAAEIAGVLADATVVVPPRLVQTLAGGGSLFVMPALDARVAITKLITFTPANVGGARPTIQGDVIVFDIATGERRLILDGPTVTARRTAAVSLLAAQRLARNPRGPLLIVGAGAQGRAHLEAFVEVLGVTEVRIASRTAASARKLARYAQSLGVRASVIADVDAQMRECPLVVTCTPADRVVLRGLPRPDAFIAAVGAFTPSMVELDPAFCRHVAEHGTIVVDTPHAQHEAGDLLQAGLDVSRMLTLCAVLTDAAHASVWAQPVSAGPASVRAEPEAASPTSVRTEPLAYSPTSVRDEPVEAARFLLPHGPVLFKSCGWAGWDLAAARTAIRSLEKA